MKSVKFYNPAMAKLSPASWVKILKDTYRNSKIIHSFRMKTDNHKKIIQTASLVLAKQLNPEFCTSPVQNLHSDRKKSKYLYNGAII